MKQVQGIMVVLAAFLIIEGLSESGSGSRDSSICDLPKVVGPCKAHLLRYYFNSDKNKCKKFYYGGCKGNANNFETKEACEETCICDLPKVVGPCKAHLLRYYFNSDKNECKKFYYGGCKGNANNFETKEACEETCICDLPKVVGPCKAAFPRYYFNSDKNECKKFYYGGCKGNANNFETKEACEETCKPS